jgi:hypothetical protein
MTGIERLESATNGTGRSSRELHSGERVDVARKERSESVQWIERFVARRPGLCLGAAFSFGVALGWWVKRL